MIKRKLFYVLAAGLIFFSCKSTDQEKSAKVDETAAVSEEENPFVINDYYGWIDPTSKNITADTGFIRITAKPKRGVFNLGVINSERFKKAIPVISEVNELNSSSFYLKYNNAVYKLQADGTVYCDGEKIQNGMRLEYSIPKVAEVVIDFTGAPTSVEVPSFDMLKVVATVQNVSGKRGDFALKAVFDTILGESTKNHFYVGEENPVNSEVLYRSMQNQKMVISKNQNAGMQFLFYGADITAPEGVLLANYSTLDNKIWEPSVTSNKPFNTVLSYNNSAVGVNWPSVKLDSNKAFRLTFYIAMSNDGSTPKGMDFLEGKKESELKQGPVERPAFVPEYEEAVAVEKHEALDVEKLPEPELEDFPVPVEDASVNVPVVEVPVVTTPKVEKSEKINQRPANDSVNPGNDKILPEPSVSKDGNSKVYPSAGVSKNSNLKYDVNKLSKEQLTPGYIQTLLDRICALEEEGAAINQDEIFQLNAELDAILSVLRQ